MMDKDNEDLAALIAEYEENPNISTKLDIAIKVNESWKNILPELLYEVIKILIKK